MRRQEPLDHAVHIRRAGCNLFCCMRLASADATDAASACRSKCFSVGSATQLSEAGALPGRAARLVHRVARMAITPMEIHVDVFIVGAGPGALDFPIKVAAFY